MSEFGFNEDETAGNEEEVLEQVGEGAPDETSDESGAGGEEPASR